MNGSTSASPCSSYQPSPRGSYNPSPSSSSFPSPTNPFGDANSLIPWLKNLSSKSPSKLPFFNGNSISAPVTPPLARSPTYDQVTIPDSGWLSGMQTPQSGPSSPTFSLVSRNPFFDKEAFKMGDSSSPMWTPGQSGNCSPAIPAGVDQNSDVPMADGMAAEFAFGMVKPWEGERIHGECVSEDLELTLGNSRTRWWFWVKKIKHRLLSIMSLIKLVNLLLFISSLFVCFFLLVWWLKVIKKGKERRRKKKTFWNSIFFLLAFD